jgi:hypothetical protein
MAGLLSGYLQGAAARRFELGTFDCCLFLADWIALKRGTDPAAAWRGRYRQIADVPAMLPLIKRLARGAGLQPTLQPAPGDVALVSIAGGPVTGAIVTARGFVVLAAGGGLSCARRARLVRAWTI